MSLQPSADEQRTEQQTHRRSEQTGRTVDIRLVPLMLLALLTLSGCVTVHNNPVPLAHTAAHHPATLPCGCAAPGYGMPNDGVATTNQHGLYGYGTYGHGAYPNGGYQAGTDLSGLPAGAQRQVINGREIIYVPVPMQTPQSPQMPQQPTNTTVVD